MQDKIIDIAREAGKIILEYYHQKNLNVRSKDKTRYDPVTDADINADEYIRRRLQEEFPSDGILSEETKTAPLDYSGRVWIVDPLDGTNEFAQKKDGFSVNIGLCENGVPVLGVVYCPLRDELYYAERGKGAYIENKGKHKRLKVSRINLFPKSAAVIKPSDKGDMPLDEIVNLKVKERIERDSAAMKIIKIAAGKVEFYIDAVFRAGKWDTCAAQIILEEAGGKITDLSGQPIDYKDEQPILKNSFVASNGIIHQKVIAEIRKCL